MNGTVMASWEDEETNRNIQFAVEFRTANGNVEVVQVTPLKVSIYCPETNVCLRTISVHTEKGRRLLARQFAESGKLLTLTEELLSRRGAHISA